MSPDYTVSTVISLLTCLVLNAGALFGNVVDTVDALTRVDDAAAADDQIEVRHSVSLRFGIGRHHPIFHQLS